MSTTLVTRESFEYSVVATFGEYSSKVSQLLMLTEVSEQELRKFKVARTCVEAIRFYFRRYDGENPPTDDDNAFTKTEIEAVVTLYNALMNTNYWFDFPEDTGSDA